MKAPLSLFSKAAMAVGGITLTLGLSVAGGSHRAQVVQASAPARLVELFSTTPLVPDCAHTNPVGPGGCLVNNTCEGWPQTLCLKILVLCECVADDGG
jgi:hypothetical protein